MNVSEIQKKILPMLEKQGVIKAALFGSVARGEAKENSDVDILVELPKGKSLFDLVELKLDLEDLLEKKVDIGTFNSLDPLIKPYAEKDMVHIL